MIDLEFEQPAWIHAIWGILILAGVVALLEIKTAKSDRGFVGKRMRGRLARTSSWSSNLAAYLFGVCALVCFVIALMRPQYGFQKKKIPQVGAQIMVCLDVSKSMLAEDASPNRLERAKSELEVLLNYLEGDQVGLIAFAGKASLLCPLTSDFGFLKLVLREATSTSVGRGGTMLETPIRRALAGFSDEEGMSKVVILITDGEDNGSKPLDAAKEAAERGIRIITIGFGHERGSKIEVTDPNTGLKSFIKDEDGKTVISRLDLDLLRKIAVATNGVLIPARTGSLDVEAIHQDHIRPLMRTTLEGELVVKNEAFQWPLMAGITFTILSIAAAHSLAFSRARFSDWLLSRSTVRLMPLALILLATNAMAQDTQLPSKNNATKNKSADTNQKSTQKKDESTEGLGAEFSGRPPEDLLPEDPIDCFNLSVDVLQSDPEYAEKLLEAARRNAGDHAVIRFRSSYNLGWAKVNQANAFLKEQPEEALKQLTSAADWFREAIRLRPKNEKARQNLEITLRRISELSDAIRKKESGGFGEQLDQLISRQSKQVQVNRNLLQTTHAEVHVSEKSKQALRLASVDQRLLNSDLQEATRLASQQLEDYRRQSAQKSGKPDDQQKGVDEQIKMAQLENALNYAGRASQRLGQSRSQLRLGNAKRAFLRSALGLDELKRARDQLRNPAEILRLIIADSKLLHEQTLALVAGRNRLAAFLGKQTHVPAWLDGPYLVQFQTTQLERTSELLQLLNSITAQNDRDQDKSESGSAEALQRERIKLAAMSIASAEGLFQEAQQFLRDQKLQSAKEQQVQAIQYLLEAYEQFADLKGLLELTYQHHNEINQKLPAAQNLSGDVLSQVARSFADQGTKNQDRLKRIVAMILQKVEEARQKPANVQSNSPGSNSNGQNQNDQTQQELKRLEFASQLANQASQLNEQLLRSWKEMEANGDMETDWNDLSSKSEELKSKLMQLRRLFFSIVEHLKETTQRQQQLSTDTEQEFLKVELQEDKQSETKANGKQKNETSQKDDQSFVPEVARKRFRPLGSRQEELAVFAKTIGNELTRMAESSQKQTQPGNTNDSAAQKMTQNYEQAAQLVLDGHIKMGEAASNLNGEEISLESVGESQQVAIEKLVEALKLLEESDNKSDKDQKSQGNKPEEQKGSDDLSSQALLQRIRDLESQRRKRRMKTPFPERVNKDW